MHEFHGDEFEALLLEPLDDVADEATMHSIGLDHDEGALFVGSHRRRELCENAQQSSNHPPLPGAGDKRKGGNMWRKR